MPIRLTIIALACCLTLMLPATAARAQTWQAKQGGIARITVPLPPGRISVHALGKEWPCKRLSNGEVLTWIGVDLTTHPGSHRLKWHITDQAGHSRTRRDTLNIVKGQFRISRIHVKKRMAVFTRKELARIHADHESIKKCYVTHVDAKPDITFRQMPVQGVISSPFGARRYVNGKPRSPHTGVDIAAPEGTPIIAPLSGRILLVHSMYLDGNTVVIGHGRGLVSVYCHLSKIDVKPGQWIKTGGKIGEVGQTGRTTGPNLHWGIRFENARVSPLALLP